jgi:hypothetical protein
MVEHHPMVDFYTKNRRFYPNVAASGFIDHGQYSLQQLNLCDEIGH